MLKEEHELGLQWREMSRQEGLFERWELLQHIHMPAEWLTRERETHDAEGNDNRNKVLCAV